MRCLVTHAEMGKPFAVHLISRGDTLAKLQAAYGLALKSWFKFNYHPSTAHSGDAQRHIGLEFFLWDLHRVASDNWQAAV